METALLSHIFVFLLAACLAVPLAARFQLGSVLGYLLAGILIGPYGLGFFDEAEKMLHFAEFGVVMMLFIIGLELEPAALWRLRRSILGLGGLQVLGTTIVLSIIGISTGHSWQESLVVSSALSLSSTAFALQTLQERNLMQTAIGRNAFSVLLFQDIAVIPLLIMFPLLAVAPSADVEVVSHSLISHLPGWQQALSVMTVIAAVVLAGHYLSHPLFRTIAKTKIREVFTATALAVIVGITLLMDFIGISPALGAFVAGMVLANSEYRRTLEAEIEPFKGLLLGLFFISVGMGMDFALLQESTASILAATLILMAVKVSIMLLLGHLFGIAKIHLYGFAFILAQGGEFAFVLFQFAGGLSILSPEMNRFLTLVVALSIAITPLLIMFYERIITPRFLSMRPAADFDKVEEQNPVILAGFGRFGQVVGRFLLSQHIPVTVLEKDPEQIALLRRFGFKGYFGDAARMDILRSAGAAQAEILVVAVDSADDCLDIINNAKKEFPHLKIYARARNRRHAYDLHKAGVVFYKRETFDSSLDLAKKILIDSGRPVLEVNRRAKKFREHDEATLQKSFAFFDNEPELINFAKLRSKELEKLLNDDAGSDETEEGSPA